MLRKIRPLIILIFLLINFFVLTQKGIAQRPKYNIGGYYTGPGELNAYIIHRGYDLEVWIGERYHGDRYTGKYISAAPPVYYTVEVDFDYEILRGTRIKGGIMWSNHTIWMYSGPEMPPLSSLKPLVNVTGTWNWGEKNLTISQSGDKLTIDISGKTFTGSFYAHNAIRIDMDSGSLFGAVVQGEVIHWGDGTVCTRNMRTRPQEVVNVSGTWKSPGEGQPRIEQNEDKLTFYDTGLGLRVGRFISANIIKAVFDHTCCYGKVVDGKIIQWSNGTEWVSPYPDISGNWEWRTEDLRVEQSGENLVVHMPGETFTGRFLSLESIRIDMNSESRNGKIVQGEVIDWSDGTAWMRKLPTWVVPRVPDLTGTWIASEGDYPRIEQNNGNLTVHVTGIGPKAGRFTSSNEIKVYFDIGCCTGTVRDGTILWSNGTTWKKSDKLRELVVQGTVRSGAFGIDLQVDARGMDVAKGEVKYKNDNGTWFDGSVSHICASKDKPNEVAITGAITAGNHPAKMRYFRIQIQDNIDGSDCFRVGWFEDLPTCWLSGKYPACVTQGNFLIN